MPDGVIFDMDGVLVDSGPAHHRSWQVLAERTGQTVSAQRFQDTFGRPSRDIIRLIWGDLSTDEVRRLDDEKEAVYRELICERVPLMPGCLDTLAGLRAADLRLAVATSGPPENLDLVLTKGAMSSFFCATVHCGDIRRGKPAPDCFLLAAERAQLAPSRCVVVEDAPVGVTGGIAAGMRVIGLAGTHPPHPLSAAGASCVVSKLSEVTPALVRELLNVG